MVREFSKSMSELDKLLIMSDFKKYWCKTQKENVWILGYFGGGAVNFKAFKEKAEQFAEEVGVSIDTISIDEVLYSRRFKHFKFLKSTQKNQEPVLHSYKTDNVMGWLHD